MNEIAKNKRLSTKHRVQNDKQHHCVEERNMKITKFCFSGTVGLHSELFHLLLLQHRYPQSFLRIDQRSIQSKNINFGFKNVKSYKKKNQFLLMSYCNHLFSSFLGQI